MKFLFVMFFSACGNFERSCPSMLLRVDQLQDRLFDIEDQMVRIGSARARGEISKEKYLLIHDAVIDIELHVLYEIDITYDKMNREGCFQ